MTETQLTEHKELQQRLEEDDTNIDEFYRPLKEYVRMVANGYRNCLMLESPTGLGKTHNIRKALADELGTDGFHMHSGFAAPLAFYKMLYQNRDEVIFLDDMAGIMGNKRALALMQQATDDEGGVRRVEWNSTTHALETTPHSFEFTGQLIMCLNQIPDNEIVRSIKGRALFYELNFSYEERMEIMSGIAEKDYESLSYDERMEVMNWLKENTVPETKGVNIRMLFECFDLYRANSDQWQDLAEELFEVNEELKTVREVTQNNDTRQDAIEEYKEETGKGRRTYYRKLEVLKKRSEAMR